MSSCLKNSFEYSNPNLLSEIDSFKNFSEIFSLEAVEAKYVRELQLLFLGLRPALMVLPASLNLSTEKDTNRFFDLMKKFGFSNKGNFIYNERKVSEIIFTYPEFFDTRIKADLIMQSLSLASLKTLNVQRGLVLGFPLEACIGFEKVSISLKRIRDEYRTLKRLIQEHQGLDFLETFVDESKIFNEIDELFAYCKYHKLISDNAILDARKEYFSLTNEAKSIAEKIGIGDFGLNFLPYNYGEETKTLIENCREALRRAGFLAE